MTVNETLKKFGLEQIEREHNGESGEEMLRTLCLQLFSLGDAEDAPLIWEAKQSSFDAGCGLDVQVLCGAGLEATKRSLAKSGVLSAAAILNFLIECERAGDFAEWTPEKTIADYRRYYRL